MKLIIKPDYGARFFTDEIATTWQSVPIVETLLPIIECGPSSAYIASEHVYVLGNSNYRATAPVRPVHLF